jgi:hypothetical protein
MIQLAMLTFEARAAIQARLAALRHEERSASASGQRAALWRAQQQITRARSLEDLRRYCLDALQRPRYLDPEDENDYLRGYRLGFQMLLRDLRGIEARRQRR